MNLNDLVIHLKQDGIKDLAVLKAIKKVDRKDFIPKKFQFQAYEDHPIEVGFGATISQPYTVAFMLQALELKQNNKVLEVGTASGWNAALISVIVGKKGKVFTTEIIPELVRKAKTKLKNSKNVKVILTDGSKGLKKCAPFDKIIVTAACPEVPNALISQLKQNGILIAPIGSLTSQEMVKITKAKNIIKESLGEFVFVPLKGKYGFTQILR